MSEHAVRPEQVLADGLVDRLDLSAPVDVRALLEQFCDVEEDAHLGKADAVMYGLAGERSRPLLVLNSTMNHKRVRFTMGHELAHLLIPWHVGTIVCHSQAEEPDGSGVTDEAPARDAEPALNHASFEAEADRFASRVLVPLRLLDQLPRDDVARSFEELEVAEVSTAVAMRALASHAAPGLALAHVAQGVIQDWQVSQGTVNPGLRRHVQLERWWSDAAEASGSALHVNDTVVWFRFRDRVAVFDVDEPWRDVLRRVIAETSGVGDDPQKTYESVASVASAANTSSLSTDPGRIAAQIVHAVRKRQELAGLVGHEDFESFAVARALEFVGMA